MSNSYEIVIQNDGTRAVDFMVFQKQPTFTNGGSQPSISSNSLGSGHLAPYSSSGTRLYFPFEAQIYAGAQTNQFNTEVVKQPVELASQKIALADGTTQPADHTSLLVHPFGLSSADHDASVPAENFGITVPSYTPSAALDLFCGVVVAQSQVKRILSCYVSPTPNSALYCAPLPVFYVTLGSTTAGDPVTYDISNAACCDFAQGYSQILVTYAADGQFTATG